MDVDFTHWLNSSVDKVNNALAKYMETAETPYDSIINAMRYSLFAGGKRIRPILSLAVNEIYESAIGEIMPFACAIEMIHTYSLIHDDLPSMDNDDFRRGMPSNHKVFGEGMAILAGDALLNFAFELMLAQLDKENKETDERKVHAMRLIANSSGIRGMIGGQTADLMSEGKKLPGKQLEDMHRHKTGALISAAIRFPAHIAGAGNDDLAKLEQYSDAFGLAFQIKDDILDVEGNLKTMGKKPGSDASSKKATFISLFGIQKAKKVMIGQLGLMKEAAGYFGSRGRYLADIAEYMNDRDR
jgi:geranylgeranyl diphosphate synthase, type II